MEGKLSMFLNHARAAIKLGIGAVAAPEPCLACGSGRARFACGAGRVGIQSASLPADELVQELISQGYPVLQRLVLCECASVRSVRLADRTLLTEDTYLRFRLLSTL